VLSVGIPITDDVVAQAVERAGRDYERWSALVAQCGYCYQPIKLVGRVFQTDKAAGEVREVYSTEGEPDNCLFVPCGNRRASMCPSCSTVYKGDVFHLILEGMIGGPTVPASVATHPMVFVTLTAPSFGAVHAHRRKGGKLEPCRPRRRRGETCPHGKRLGCFVKHTEDDPCLGTPLCDECFDYEAQVLWNRLAPRLWERTIIYVRRTLARAAGMRIKDFEQVCRKPEFAKIAELQKRGAIHFHAVFRLDGRGPEGGIADPPAVFTTQLLAQAIEETVRRVEVTPREAGERVTLRWGSELHIRALRPGGSGDVSQEAVAAYAAKYATKGSEAFLLDSGRVSGHIRRVRDTACDLGIRKEYAELRLMEAAPSLGYRGHFSTRSRRYSSTLTAKRQARMEYARRRRANGGELLDAWDRPEALGAVVVDARWRFAGAGYRNKGEQLLAFSAAAHAREARQEAREAMWAMRQKAS
jgi:hypothetical protein